MVSQISLMPASYAIFVSCATPEKKELALGKLNQGLVLLLLGRKGVVLKGLGQ